MERGVKRRRVDEEPQEVGFWGRIKNYIFGSDVEVTEENPKVVPSSAKRRRTTPDTLHNNDDATKEDNEQSFEDQLRDQLKRGAITPAARKKYVRLLEGDTQQETSPRSTTSASPAAAIVRDFSRSITPLRAISGGLNTVGGTYTPSYSRAQATSRSPLFSARNDSPRGQKRKQRANTEPRREAAPSAHTNGSANDAGGRKGTANGSPAPIRSTPRRLPVESRVSTTPLVHAKAQQILDTLDEFGPLVTEVRRGIRSKPPPYADEKRLKDRLVRHLDQDSSDEEPDSTFSNQTTSELRTHTQPPSVKKRRVATSPPRKAAVDVSNNTDASDWSARALPHKSKANPNPALTAASPSFHTAALDTSESTVVPPKPAVTSKVDQPAIKPVPTTTPFSTGASPIIPPPSVFGASFLAPAATKGEDKEAANPLKIDASIFANKSEDKDTSKLATSNTGFVVAPWPTPDKVSAPLPLTTLSTTSPFIPATTSPLVADFSTTSTTPAATSTVAPISLITATQTTPSLATSTTSILASASEMPSLSSSTSVLSTASLLPAVDSSSSGNSTSPYQHGTSPFGGAGGIKADLSWLAKTPALPKSEITKDNDATSSPVLPLTTNKLTAFSPDSTFLKTSEVVVSDKPEPEGKSTTAIKSSGVDKTAFGAVGVFGAPLSVPSFSLNPSASKTPEVAPASSATPDTSKETPQGDTPSNANIPKVDTASKPFALPDSLSLVPSKTSKEEVQATTKSSLTAATSPSIAFPLSTFPASPFPVLKTTDDASSKPAAASAWASSTPFGITKPEVSETKKDTSLPQMFAFGAAPSTATTKDSLQSASSASDSMEPDSMAEAPFGGPSPFATSAPFAGAGGFSFTAASTLASTSTPAASTGLFVFGQNSGAPPSTPAPTSEPFAFGATSTAAPSVFGVPSQPQTSVFGGSAFGAGTPSAFDSSSGGVPFGGQAPSGFPSASPFSATTPTTPFGAPSTSAFAGFGPSSTPAFSAATNEPFGFGATTTATPSGTGAPFMFGGAVDTPGSAGGFSLGAAPNKERRIVKAARRGRR